MLNHPHSIRTLTREKNFACQKKHAEKSHVLQKIKWQVKKNLHPESQKKTMKGRGAHSVFQKSKKYFNSSELGVLSTTANSNLGSADTGAVAAVREEQKQDFDQNQDSGPSYS